MSLIMCSSTAERPDDTTVIYKENKNEKLAREYKEQGIERSNL